MRDKIDWDQRQLLEFKVSLVTLLQNRMWPCGGGWTRGDELRGHGTLCILNVNNKIPQDDAGLYMIVGKSDVPEAACRVEKMQNSPSCGF